jgi:putative ABC transport system substrate-binding protein
MTGLGRRTFIAGLGGVAAWPVAARAQPATWPIIGFLDSRSPLAASSRVRAFREGLGNTGYIEGENLTILFRWADNRIERLSALAADLVRLGVAAIAAVGPSGASAVKAATTTIPVVFVTSDDPVAAGLVANLARPGGNLTGINFEDSELAGKRLGLLHEMVPGAVRIAVLVNPAEANRTESTLREVEAAARSMGLKIQVLKADTSDEINAAFESIGRERPDALFVATTPFLNVRLVQIAQLAAYYRLPATHSLREFVEVGGLMSYGSNIADAFRQAGVYTGRILKGANPADLPVALASKLELVINAQTAHMLGLTLRPSSLSQVAEVIE